MAHYAFLDENNIVTEVIVGKDETELIDGLDPETWYGNFRGQTCKRTSYNTSAGINIRENGLPFRKNFAAKGYFYDENRDAFIPPSPYPSWILNEETCHWQPPTPKPEVTELIGWRWNEENMGSYKRNTA
jgi:hypothetical protein